MPSKKVSSIEEVDVLSNKMDAILAYLYYWFSVGEGTLPLHHLIAQNTPNKKNPHQFSHLVA
jgi:hypothetical protein